MGDYDIFLEENLDNIPAVDFEDGYVPEYPKGYSVKFIKTGEVINLLATDELSAKKEVDALLSYDRGTARLRHDKEGEVGFRWFYEMGDEHWWDNWDN